MEIIIPENNKDGQKVLDFLESNFTDVQRVEIFEKIEICEKFCSLELIQKHRIEKIEKHLYELRVQISKIKLRFFGVLYGEKLILIHVFCKKSPKIPKRELELSKSKASLLIIKNY